MRYKEILSQMLKGESVSFGRIKQVLNDTLLIEDKRGNVEKFRVDAGAMYQVGQVLSYIRRKGQKIQILGTVDKTGYFDKTTTFRIL